MNLKKVWIKWSQLNINWSAINLTWSELYTFIEVTNKIGGGASGVAVDKKRPWSDIENKLDSKTSDDFLNIMVRVNGLDKKNIESIKNSITVDHLKKTISVVMPKVTVEKDLI